MPPDPLTLAVLLAGTGAGAAIDLRTQRVPNVLTASIAAAGLALAAAGAGRMDVPAAAAGCLLGVLLMLPGYLLGTTGGGDVKLFGAAGTLLGPAHTTWAFVFTLIAGGAIALVVAAYRGRLFVTFQGLIEVRSVRLQADEASDPGNRFAYAPAITIGVLAAAVFL